MNKLYSGCLVLGGKDPLRWFNEEVFGAYSFVTALVEGLSDHV